jgi:hypothetical protein
MSPKLTMEQRAEVRRRAKTGRDSVAHNRALAKEFGISFYSVRHLARTPDPATVNRDGKRGPKLTVGQRDEIRRRGMVGPGSTEHNKRLAAEYGISYSAVRHIIRTPHSHENCQANNCKCSPRALPPDELARLRRLVGLG